MLLRLFVEKNKHEMAAFLEQKLNKSDFNNIGQNRRIKDGCGPAWPENIILEPGLKRVQCPQLNITRSKKINANNIAESTTSTQQRKMSVLESGTHHINLYY